MGPDDVCSLIVIVSLLLVLMLVVVLLFDALGLYFTQTNDYKANTVCMPNAFKVKKKYTQMERERERGDFNIVCRMHSNATVRRHC